MAGRAAPPGRHNSRILLAVTLLGLMIAAFPTFIIVVVGLVPTFFVRMADESPGAAMMRAVFPANLVGVLYVVTVLWESGHSYENALMVVTTTVHLATMYVGALVGFLIYLAVPVVNVALAQMQNRTRRQTLAARIEGLKAEWGEDVLASREDG